MREDRITVLKVEPRKAPELVTIDNTLKGLQDAVGGLIEVLWLDKGEALLLNEEGKLIGLEPNRYLRTFNFDSNDIIFGTFFVCSEESDEDTYFASLPTSAINKYMELLKEPDDIQWSDIFDMFFGVINIDDIE